MGNYPSLFVCCHGSPTDDDSCDGSSIPSVLHLSFDKPRLSKSYSGTSPSPGCGNDGSVRSLVSQADGRHWSGEIFERKFSARRLERAELMYSSRPGDHQPSLNSVPSTSRRPNLPRLSSVYHAGSQTAPQSGNNRELRYRGFRRPPLGPLSRSYTLKLTGRGVQEPTRFSV
ncbi:hypothetical protein FOZ60_002964 [Perkinsus olseni]|uniref:Uncharacterized protein n=1 Tax=Perkinsus olseni TaxID=32597 RepID=A0A7J6NWS4_PEROL|nr:hypothetical protein FOZ60_002964 [Perkinsus olseni]